MYAETEKFLAGILGGRYQESMEDDVKNTLEKIRVDISKVKYEPKKSVAAAAKLPAIANIWKAGKTEYKMAIDVQGQHLAMDMVRTIEAQDQNWLVTESVTGAMGQMKDAIVFRNDGSPVSRAMEQMGQKVSMSFEEKKAILEMQGKKFDMEFNSAYLNDGPGCDQILANWPLKDGYEIVVEVPDMSTMKAKQVKIAVIGKETCNLNDCWKVEMVSTDNANDKTTYWIDPATKMAEKIVSVMPAMGNAVMTIEKK